MDGLSAAASGIAVVSIAIQVSDSLQKVSDFIELIQEAPEEIESTSFELRLLSSLLEDIRLHNPLLSSNPSAQAILGSLEKKITSFMDVVNRYKPGLDSPSRRRKKWSAFKVASKREKFKKLRESLNDTKSTLILALQAFRINSSQISPQQPALSISGEELSSQSNRSSIDIASSTTHTSSPYDGLVNDLREEIQKLASTMKDPIQQAMYQCLERMMLGRTVKQIGSVLEERGEEEEEDDDDDDAAKPESGIEVEDVSSDTQVVSRGIHLDSDVSPVKQPGQRRSRARTKSIASRSRTFFGIFYLKSKVYEDRGVFHYENFYMFHPANWLVSLGVKTSLDVLISRSTQGWKNNLSSRTFRAVPKDALIFQFCRDGNLEGVKTLLARGDASLMDRSPNGRTLLHIAMYRNRYSLCKFLIKQGAPKDAIDFVEGQIHHSQPLHLNWRYHLSSEPVDFDVIRSCLEHVDYDDDQSKSLMTLFCLHTYSESDEMYNVIQSNEGEKIYPRIKSTCQLMLDIYGSEIRESLTWGYIRNIWMASGSLLFLRWLMTLDSEAFTIDRDTAWWIIVTLLLAPSFRSPKSPLYNSYARLDSTKEKIKFLVERGTSLHHVEDGETLTSRAMTDAAAFHLWCDVLQELKIDLHAFFEEEAEQNLFQMPTWNKRTYLALFRESALHKSDRDKFEWDDGHYCLRCESLLLTFWEYYLSVFTKYSSKFSHDEVENAGKVGNYICEIQDSSEHDDEVCQNDESVSDDQDEEFSNDDDEPGNDDEVKNDNPAENDPDVENKADIEIENEMRKDNKKAENDKKAGNNVNDNDDEVNNIDQASSDEDERKDTDEEVTLADRIYEIYKTHFGEGLCKSCQETSSSSSSSQLFMNHLPMPGSFDSS